MLAQIKNKASDNDIKNGLERMVRDKSNDDGVIEMIKNYEGHILMLAMQVIKKLLK